MTGSIGLAERYFMRSGEAPSVLRNMV